MTTTELVSEAGEITDDEVKAIRFYLKHGFFDEAFRTWVPKILRRLERTHAERKKLTEALDLLVHLNRGVNPGGEFPAESDWETAWAAAEALLAELQGEETRSE